MSLTSFDNLFNILMLLYRLLIFCMFVCCLPLSDAKYMMGQFARVEQEHIQVLDVNFQLGLIMHADFTMFWIVSITHFCAKADINLLHYIS